MKTCLIGHRTIIADISERIEKAVVREMMNGCMTFMVGTHGDFDGLALAVCRHLRRTFSDINIEVVITSRNALKKIKGEDSQYDDVKTVMYDVEKVHYKQRITVSNRQMIDECDTLICYVNENSYQSGAKSAMKYAKKKGLKIVNLYRTEDDPLFGLPEEEKNKLYDRLLEEIKKLDEK